MNKEGIYLFFLRLILCYNMFNDEQFEEENKCG